MSVQLDSLMHEALESWQFTRDGVIAEAESIDEAQYEWRPSPRSRSVTELIQHIVESGLMAVGELTRPDGDFQRQPYPEFMREYAADVHRITGKEALIELLRDTYASGVEQFLATGELGVLQYIRRFDGKRGTRLAWLYHLVDHESYHRGQLALYVRQLGHVPALTRMITGES